MKVRRRLLALGALAAVIVAALTLVSQNAGATPVCTDTFTGASGGDWATAANWSTQVVPGQNDVACWAGGVSVVVSAGTQTAGSVQGGSLKLTAGKLVLTATTNDSSLTNLSLDGNAGLSVPAAQTIDVTGNFEWGACTPSCATPQLDATINQTGSGTFAIDGTGGISGPDWLGGSITTTRPVSITNGSFESNGAEMLTTTSTIDVSTVQLTGLDPSTTFQCAGLQSATGNYGFWDSIVKLTGGTTTIADNSDFQAGSITLAGGTLRDDGGIVRGGSGLSTMTLTGGTLLGRGNMGNLTNVSGTIAPGDPGGADTLDVSGAFIQDPGGTITESPGGSSFGLLQIDGTAALAGDVSLTDAPGFTPQANQQFTMLIADGGDSGTFTLTGPSASEYTGSYPSEVVRLVASSSATTTTTTTTTASTTTTSASTSPSPTTSTTSTSPPGQHGAAPGVPVDITPPVISGNPTPGHSLRCSTGTWTNDPTSYAVVWHEGARVVSRSATFAVQIGDEGAALTCTVTATNGAGAGAPATSAPAIVAEPGTLRCPAPTGRLTATTVGPLALGITQTRARHLLTRFNVTANDFDNFCLYGGWGIRVGYPSASILRGLPAGHRTALKNRIVLALTANPYYALEGVRPGARLSAVARHLGVGRSFHIGLNFWYLAPLGPTRAVLKVRGGIVQEVGIANRRLTAGNRTAQRRFLASFTKA